MKPAPPVTRARGIENPRGSGSNVATFLVAGMPRVLAEISGKHNRLRELRRECELSQIDATFHTLTSFDRSRCWPHLRRRGAVPSRSAAALACGEFARGLPPANTSDSG